MKIENCNEDDNGELVELVLIEVDDFLTINLSILGVVPFIMKYNKITNTYTTRTVQ